MPKELSEVPKLLLFPFSPQGISLSLGISLSQGIYSSQGVSLCQDDEWHLSVAT